MEVEFTCSRFDMQYHSGRDHVTADILSSVQCSDMLNELHNSL